MIWYDTVKTYISKYWTFILAQKNWVHFPLLIGSVKAIWAPHTLLIRLQIRLKPNPPDHKGANMGLSYGAAVSQRGLVKLPFIGGSPTHQVQPTPPLQIVQYLIANSCQSVGLWGRCMYVADCHKLCHVRQDFPRNHLLGTCEIIC